MALFPRPGDKLSAVRHRPVFKRLASNTALLAMLALQLMLGLQLQAAQAVALPTSSSMRMSSMHTPTHGSHSSSAPTSEAPTYSSFGPTSAAPAHASSGPTSAAHAYSPLASPADSAATPDCHTHSAPRDCCHAGACQCHCVYTPAVIALPISANTTTSAAVPALASTQFVAPRIHEFLRPPIA